MIHDLPFIFLGVSQLAFLAIIGWHFTRDDEHWWRIHERQMRRRGLEPVRGADWQQGVRRQRKALLYGVIVVMGMSLAMWAVLWNVVR